MATFYSDTGSFEILNVTNLTATTSSILYLTQSQLNVQDNIITVNTLLPTTRFGGLAVIDSGSSPQTSGSLLFDSLNNQWIYVHQSSAGAAITSSVLIMGPQTFNNVGNETTIATNRLTKGSGGDLGEHITSSNITDTGTLVSINSNTEVTGSLLVSTSVTASVISASSGITGSLLGTASFANLANVNISAGANTANVSQLVFSNANNVTFGINAGTITATAAGGAANINVSAGTTSNNVSQLIFSNANNHTFGLNSNTITVSYQSPVESYWENMPFIANSSFHSFTGGLSQIVQPFQLPYDISISYLRILLSNSFNSTTFATTANNSYTLQQSITYWANIYSLGTGTNATALQHIAQAVTGQTYQIRAHVGAASNNQTVSHNMTYPALGGAASQFATNYNVNAASVQVSTTHLTIFNAGRALDIPFATSLSAGEYWIAFQKSSATATTGGQLSNITLANSVLGASQINSNFSPMGLASNNSSNPFNIGLGSWSTNSSGVTTSTIALNALSSLASNQKTYFGFIRIA